MTTALSHTIDRRMFLRSIAGTAVLPLAGCAARAGHAAVCSQLSPAPEIEDVEGFGSRKVYMIRGSSGPALIVLHELPGLSPDDIALGRRLAGNGFTVYLPLLFGEKNQNRFAVGYLQSCMTRDFVCSTPSTTSPIVTWVKEVCETIGRRSRGPIGVIGMCLTGTFPLALLGNTVRAAVLCQPTLPFGLLAAVFGLSERDRHDVGLSQTDLDSARASDVPLLALRYLDDWRCPNERMKKLQTLFPGRLAVIEIESRHHPVGGHHSTLAGDCDRDAFADTVAYLGARLGLAREARDMRLAKFQDTACRMTADGRWETR